MRLRRPAARYFSGLISCIICCALLASPTSSALQGARSSQPNAARPEKGAPGANLPNLDDVKRRAPARPKAQTPVPSRLKKYRFERKGVEPSPRAELDATAASSLAGAQIAAVYNPYEGVEVASAGRSLPAPPPSRSPARADSGWSAPLATLFGALATTFRRSAEGEFEPADCSVVSGWAWDTAQPNTPIIVTLFDGSRPEPVFSVLADQYRADLVSRGKGDGRHGFSFPLPDSLRDGASHTLYLKVQGTGYTLAYSPKVISSCTFAYAGAITSADCEQVTGWAWDAQRPNTPIDVDLYVDGIFRARASADVYNAQLGKGDNRHQFRVPTPVAARDGQTHAITVRPAGSGQTLGSPASVTCNGPSYDGYLDGANCTWVYGWAWDSNRPNTPINVDLYSDGQFVTTVTADTYRPDLAGLGDGRHAFQIAVPNSLRGGATHTLTARVGGGGPMLNLTASLSCPALSSCSASQSLPSTEFVKDFYLGAMARQPRPLELQYWNDVLRSAAAQGQAQLLAKAKLLGRELFLEGEYAVRGRMLSGHEAEYVSDLYWAYLQRGPDASGQSTWVGNIQADNTQTGQPGWMNALNAFQESGEFSARVSGVCPAPSDSVKSYDAAADFSPLQNADGAWSYGYRPAGGAFTLFPSSANVFGAGTDSWTQPSISACCPFVTRNNTGGTLPYAGNVVQPTGMLNLHPGPSGERGVVRWTAPAAGTYVLSGSFQGISSSGTTSDVLIVHNGTTLFGANVNGFGATAPFAVTRYDVQAGDTVEFSVGVGTNGNYNGDSTGLALTIYQPSPAQTQAYGGTAAQAPGKIEAELFDDGGEGVAYHDTTQGSHGQDYDQPPNYPPPSFRNTTDVDIYKSAAGFSNGYLVVMQAGDWMNYTVDVARAGSYTLSAQTYYWETPGGTFHVEADGADVTGPIQLPGGSSWQTVAKAGVQLNAGRHVLRVVCDTNGAGGYMGDIDYLRLTPSADSGLVGYWKFDEGAGTAAADSSGGGHPGTLQAGAGWAAGSSGSSASFDGADDYVQVGAGVPAAGAALTVSAWVYPTGGGTAGAGGVIVNREGEYEVARFPDGTIQWAIANQSPGWGWVNTGYVARPSRWTHITFTYDGVSAKTYADGQLVHTAAASGAIGDVLPAQNDFRIGGRQATPQFFQGRLDEVRVYNRALAGGEVGALAAAGGADPTGNNFSEARKDPANETGSGGDDPLSRNFSFSVPLAGLEGRAGLDLGLSLSYNSLVWTRDAVTGAVKFDTDDGDPSPGFRLGLPIIQAKYKNARNENAYMLVTPSGDHVELRQVGTSTTYEAIDSSYTQLTEENGLVLRPADGSQISFTLQGSAFKPTKIKDRNGNYISLAYNPTGDVSSITDTLGRVITFTYDANARPISVEQDRGGQAHQWATFGYSNLTVSTGFAGSVGVLGPANGMVISVLTQVGLDDGSRYNFLYNSWGQVYRVERHAPDGRLLSYSEYDLQSPTAAQTNGGTDCPRFTQRRDFAKDWNGDAPAVTTYSVDQSGAQLMKNSQTLAGGAGADTSTTVMQKIGYGAANTFRRGLVTSVETWGQDTPGQFVLKRTAQTTWTQDDESLTYQLNPRVKVAEVFDPQQNHTGTSYEYTSYGLVTEAKEWSGSESGVLRRTHTEYNLDPAYVGRRVLGLVSSTSGYDAAGHIASKVDYIYDQGGEFLQYQGEPVQHDGTNYGATFVLGRGLVTSVRRWDVTALHDVSQSVESRAGYNTTGSAVFSRDPLGHQSTIAYADRFADKWGTNTLAYPTLATDADGYSSKVEYNFYTGLVSRTEDPKGAQQTFTYDATGHTLRVEVSGRGAAASQVISGGYTRWVYSEAMDAVQSWTQVDAGMPEVCSISIFDGAGRVRATADDLPNSTGGYSARYVSYDIAGRAAGQTNPTEVNGLWNPTGDDAARGWKWTTQTFDWKSRPLVTTLPKLLNPGDPGYANEQPVTRQAEYGGCGGAGGEVVTLTDEAGRRQRLTSDPLGRQIKAETLKPNGSVYSTVTNTYNTLDQVTEMRQLVGTDGAAQVTTLAYDGHGRLKTRHLPKYAGNATTSYVYDADDTLISMTDPRGVVTTYGFTNAANYANKRHLVNSVSYGLGNNPPPDVSVPSPARFEYDEVGNRTSMTDGTGSFGYVYNGLSRLTSETRQFNALQGRTYQINYDYTLSGKLKSVSEQGGSSVQYRYDVAGRMLDATGSGPTGAATYASNMQYRAWGALKDVDFGNQTHQYVGYDARLRAATMELRNVIVNTSNQTPLTMTWNYDYNMDGRLNHAYDVQDNRFDRKFDYDEYGRLKEAYTGLEARGQAPTVPANSPFRQTFGYDEWGNMTARSGRLWKHELAGESSTYGTDDRRDGWTYDAAGNLTASTSNVNTYDAAGSQTYSHDPGNGACSPYDYEIAQEYDGEGRPAHRVQTRRRDIGALQCAADVEETYYVYSSALGGAKLMELSASGEKVKGYVYGGGMLLAKQEIYPATNGSAVKWRHANPGSASWVETASNRVFERQEMDPLGQEVGTADPFISIIDPNYADVHSDTPMFLDGGDPFHLSDGCGTIDGMPASCTEISERSQDGTAVSPVEIWGRKRNGNGNLVNFVQNATPGAAQASLGISVPGTVWVADWGPCIDNGKPQGDVCARDIGYFRQLPGQGGTLNTQIIPQRPLGLPIDIGGIREGLEKYLADSTCARFIQDLLGQVASDSNPLVEGGDLLKVFDKVVSQRGVVRDYVPGGGEARGSIGGRDGAQMAINITRFGGNPTPGEKYVLGLELDRIIALHETIHFAGLNGYDDFVLAAAVAKMNHTTVPDTKGLKPLAAAFKMSNFWNQELKNKCPDSLMRMR